MTETELALQEQAKGVMLQTLAKALAQIQELKRDCQLLLLENAALKTLCSQAADALEEMSDQHGLNRPALIAKLRHGARLK